MPTALIIGGTRNLGPDLTAALLEAGFAVSLFHRGVTPPPPLPPGRKAVEFLHGDRSDASSLAAAIGAREFDAVIDTTLYNGPDAAAAARLFRNGRAGRYVMLSTGQVYLVRDPAPARPFRESDYAGATMPHPGATASAFDLDNWTYGVEKRAAEEALLAEPALPVTILRLPMVNSARDHHYRLKNYVARLRDGGPILLPEGPDLPVRHVYGPDVVAAVLRAMAGPAGVYNVGQDETLTIEDWLARVAQRCGVSAGLRIQRVPAARLWELGLLPRCSPFSEPWMSALDNTLGKQALGLRYTPVNATLDALVPAAMAEGAPPVGYATQRAAELRCA